MREALSYIHRRPEFLCPPVPGEVAGCSRPGQGDRPGTGSRTAGVDVSARGRPHFSGVTSITVARSRIHSSGDAEQTLLQIDIALQGSALPGKSDLPELQQAPTDAWWTTAAGALAIVRQLS